MKGDECTIAGCELPQLARGLCQPHYYRDRKYGSPHLGPPIRAKFSSISERFWSKVDKSGNCWLWTGGYYLDGRGSFNIRRNGRKTTTAASRMAFILTNGDIPRSMDVDHMCFNVKCVNPSHLRLATRKQNCENRKGAQSNSKSGVRGVWWVEKHKKWEAVVMESHGAVRRRHYCGMYDNIDDAAEAAKKKRLELFTYNLVDRRAQ